MKTKKQQPVSALELARQILDRDGIRPLMGKAFTQTELDMIDAAVRQATEEKATFNIAVQTQRTEFVSTIKQPLYLSPEEAQSLANDMIALKQDVNEWKEKWQFRKDKMDEWQKQLVQARQLLNSIN